MPRLWRSTSTQPRLASRAWMLRLRAGWLRCTASAARAKWPCSARATKWRSWRRSFMRTLHRYADKNALELCAMLGQSAAIPTNTTSRAMNLTRRLGGLLLATALPCTALAELPTERIAPSIHPELKEHTAYFSQQLYKVADNVWSAVGWQ